MSASAVWKVAGFASQEEYDAWCKRQWAQLDARPDRKRTRVVPYDGRQIVIREQPNDK